LNKNSYGPYGTKSATLWFSAPVAFFPSSEDFHVAMCMATRILQEKMKAHVHPSGGMPLSSHSSSKTTYSLFSR
jgi:hypothetical protein